MGMLYGPKKFKQLFKEMFEGSKFDIGCLMRRFNKDVKWSKQVQTIV